MIAETGSMAEFDLQLTDGRMVVSGDIDAATAGRFVEALLQAPPDVRIHLGSCTFMDSSGVNALVGAKTGLNPDLVLVDVSEPVRLVLAVCGLTWAFGIEADAPPATP